jgi:hypothetical protein
MMRRATGLLSKVRIVLATMAIIFTAASAQATCQIDAISAGSGIVAASSVSLSTSHSGVAANPVTLTFTHNTNGGIGNPCGFTIKISGNLTNPAGGTIPYAIATDSGGAGVISATNPTSGLFTLSGPSVSTPPPTTVYFIINNNVGATYPTGLYTDHSAFIEVFDNKSLVVSAAVTVSFDYQSKSCTIGNSANGGSRTLDFSSGSTISTVGKPSNDATFGAVVCNSPATISLESSSGAARNKAAAGGGYQNYFDYKAETTVNGAKATLNTNGANAGPQSSTAAITAATTSTPSLTVTVTPKSPVPKLVAGTYSDTLTVTITAN